MDVNLPSINELSQMEFMSPLAYQQAQRQIDLATQFQNQNLAIGAQNLQAKTLDNLFQTQNDPLKLAHQGLVNSGLDITNKTNALELTPEAIAAKRQKWITQLGDDQLKEQMTRAQKWMVSEDPQEQTKGMDLYLRSAGEVDKRQKQRDALEKQTLVNSGSADVARIHAEASKYSADRIAGSRVDAARIRSQMAQDADSALGMAKNDAAYVNAAESWASKYRGDSSQEGQEAANYYQALAERRKAEMLQRTTASGAARLAQTPDINKMSNGAIPVVGNQQAALPPVPQRPAHLGAIAPPTPVPTQGGGAGNPPAGSGLPQTPGGPADDPVEGVRRTTKDLQDAIAARASLQTNPNIPAKEKGALDAHIKTLQADLVNYQKLAGLPAAPTQTAPQPQAPAAPQAPRAAVPTPSGMVAVTDKNGNNGFIPQEKLAAALKAGYKQR